MDATQENRLNIMFSVFCGWRAAAFAVERIIIIFSQFRRNYYLLMKTRQLRFESRTLECFCFSKFNFGFVHRNEEPTFHLM